LDTLAGGPVRYILNQILWDRTQRLPILGPLTAQRWQQYKAFQITGPIIQYRIRGNRLLILPNPVAGHTIAGEFCQRRTISADGVLAPSKEFFTADTDVCIIPDRVLIAGLRWRVKREKGLTYAEDLRRYETIVGGYCLKDSTGATVTLDDCDSGQILKPFVIIPSGSTIPP
jgi:hypothetical protein